MLRRTGVVASAGALMVMAAGSALTTCGVESARAAGTWSWPVKGEVITPYRNGSDPYAGGQHRGIDVAAASGTPVVAAAAGTVRFAGVAGSSGLTVSLRTADGRFDSSYLHLSAIDVRKGDRVGAGGRVGAVGTSGRRSAAAAHLHFGIREAGSRHVYRDPLDFLLPPTAAPVRDVPRGAPLPVGAPIPVKPAPKPVPKPLRAPRPVPGRSRVRVPAGGRVRIPHARRAPHGAAPRPAPVPVGVGIPARGRAPARAPRQSPSTGPASVLGLPPQPALPPSPARRPAPVAEGGRWASVGWGLACAGLLMAAACLGRPTDRRRNAQRARPALRTLLRPLLGGR